MDRVRESCKQDAIFGDECVRAECPRTTPTTGCPTVSARPRLRFTRGFPNRKESLLLRFTGRRLTCPNVVAGIALLAALLVPASALALPPSTPDPQAWVPNNIVTSVLHHGTTTWVGGRFDSWGPFTGEAASVAVAGGAPDPGFPRVLGGTVYAAAPDGAGGTYLSGSFTQIGIQVTSGVVHLSATGQLLFSILIDGGYVRALALGPDGVLYLGGDFTLVGGVARRRLAAVNATTGALVTTWKACVDKSPDSDDADNNKVFALGLSGSTLYVGGDFDGAGTMDSGGLCATTATRNNAAAFSTAAGSAVAAWNPDLDEEVRAVLPNAAGSLVYLGGQFTHVGAALIPRLAVVGASTGAASTGWVPKANETVNALALGSGGAVYAGGQFTTIGSNQLARAGLAEISGTGIAIAAFDAHLHGPWSAGEPTVEALATGGSPQRLYVGGYFDRGADGALANLAAADPTTGALDSTFAPAPGGLVRALAVGPTRVVAGGDFQSVGTQPHPGAVALDGDGHPKPGFVLSDPGAIERMVLSPDGSTIYALGQWPSKQLAAFNATTGQELPFAPTPDGQVEAIALSPDGRTLYLGGAFDQVDGQERKDLAAVNTSDGSLTAWKPEPDAAVAALASDGSTVYAGGDFTHIGTSIDARSGLAALSASTGDATAWNPSPNGYVNVIAPAPDGTHVYVAGAFTSIGTSPQARGGVAELTVGSGNPTPFDPYPDGHVNELVPTADGNTVYVSGQISAVGSAAAGQLGRVESGGGFSTQWVDDLPDTYGGFPSFDADGDTVWLGTMTRPSDGRIYWVQYTSAPVVAGAPGLTGAPAVGVAVGCGGAVWRNAPAEITTSWTADGAPIAGASGESYTPVAGDAGRRLACVQEGRNSAGSASAASAGQVVAGGPAGGGAPGGGGATGGGAPGGGGPALPGGGGAPKAVAAKPPTLKVHVKTPVKARKGVSLTFTLSTAATVSVVIQRVRPGRLVGKKCRAPGKHPHGKSCTLLSAAGSASWKSGTKKVLTVVLRRLKGKALTAGTYRATFTARIGTGPRSKAVTETIRVR
jgi:hypothetical protein